MDLHGAAEDGLWADVQLMLAAGADANARNAKDSTPLHLAARADHGLTVAALLAAGADREALDSKRRTPLHLAASCGATSAMHQLFLYGANMAAADKSGNTPLHLASSQRQSLATSWLISWGANVNQAGGDRYTPLHAACEHGSLEVVRALLGAGANMWSRCKQGHTPLAIACKRRHLGVVQELLSCGRGSAAALEPNKAGWLPLHIACNGGCVSVVQSLLAMPALRGAVNRPTHQGASPLSLACEMGHDGVVSSLAMAGANIHQQGLEGLTLLHTAIKHHKSAVVAQLLALGALANGVHNSLHAAAAAGDVAILEMVLAAVAAGDLGRELAAMVNGCSPLHMAVRHGRWKCVGVLLAAGANPNQLYGAGSFFAGACPLHEAVDNGGVRGMQPLFTPANLQHVWHGKTPLHTALWPGNGRVVRALVDAGAPLGLKDQHGATPISIAADSHHSDVRALLPRMVRRDCMKFLQLQQQQEEEAGGAQGQGQQQGGQQHALSDVLERAAGGVYSLLATQQMKLSVAAIKVVLEVLGPTAASSLVRQVMQKFILAAGGPDEDGEADAAVLNGALLLGQVLHKGWLAVLQPQINLWRRITSRLQGMVVQPLLMYLHQQEQHLPAAAAAAAAAAQQAASAPTKCTELYSQGVAAAGAAQWQLFVDRFEQLAAAQPYQAELLTHQLMQAAVQPGVGQWDGAAGLCEAVLAAWWLAQQGQTARARRELVEAVLGAVQAWEQVPGSRHRCSSPCQAVIRP